MTPAHEGSTGFLRERIHVMEVSLRRIGAGNPRLEAELLLCSALQCNRVELLSNPERPLSADEEQRLEELLDRRLCGEPLAYVLGNADFMGLYLEVGPGVLIPRSETELLVEKIGDELEALRREEGLPGDAPLRVLDIGTGSGAILIALATLDPAIRGVGTDSSREALAYAHRNISRHNLTERIQLVAGDLFGAFRDPSAAPAFDAVISNPPYIRAGDLPDLPREIREHEPRAALDGGPEGMDLLRHLVQEAWRWIRPYGLLAVEISLEQSRPLRAWTEAQGRYESVRIIKDLAGRDRFLFARRRP